MKLSCFCCFPTETEVASLDLTYRFTIEPEDDAFNIMFLEPFTDCIVVTLNCDRLSVSMLYKDILCQKIRICLEVRSDCFISTVSKLSVKRSCTIESIYEPFVVRIAVINLDPVRMMACYRVRLATSDCTFRCFLAMLCVVTLIELTIDDCTAGTVNLCESCAVKQSVFATCSNSVSYIDNLAVFEFTDE